MQGRTESKGAGRRSLQGRAGVIGRLDEEGEGGGNVGGALAIWAGWLVIADEGRL